MALLCIFLGLYVIPCPRKKVGCPVYERIGIYAYRKNSLLKHIQLPPTPLERTESLEQLRALECGYKIKVIVTKKHIGLQVLILKKTWNQNILATCT